MAFEDKTLVCRECGDAFTFSAGEQEFYQSRGLLNEPSRCASCRSIRRRSGGDSRSGQPRTMHPAVCATCGVSTEVPFEPREGRPVYCNDCFRTARATESF